MAEREAHIETDSGRHVATIRLDERDVPDGLQRAAQNWLSADGWDRDTWPDFKVRSGRYEMRAA
jgi:hypothetical protein